MWPALEGFIVILALILIFGIISLPPRAKKGHASRVEAGMPEDTINRAVPDTSTALQQAARGKENISYSVDQKIPDKAPTSAKGA
jgi:hypothetical protein